MVLLPRDAPRQRPDADGAAAVMVGVAGAEAEAEAEAPESACPPSGYPPSGYRGGRSPAPPVKVLVPESRAGFGGRGAQNTVALGEWRLLGMGGRVSNRATRSGAPLSERRGAPPGGPGAPDPERLCPLSGDRGDFCPEITESSVISVRSYRTILWTTCFVAS